MTRIAWTLIASVTVPAIMIMATLATFAAPAAKTIEIEASEFKYMPDVILASVAEDLTINLKHVGAANIPHDIAFDLGGGRIEQTARIRGGEAVSLTFTTPLVTGVYDFYCTVGNHRQNGMFGKLRVTQNGGPTVITGLNNPHGIAVTDDGTLLVSEGGTGTAMAGQFAPGNADGRVQWISATEPPTRTVIVNDLTNSVDPGGGVVGANHSIPWEPAGPITGTTGMVLIAQSGGPGQARPADAAKILIADAGGVTTVFADTLAYEQANNPGGEDGAAGIDSNPWRLAPGPDGMIYIPDSGANDVLKMDPITGTLSTYAVFAEINDGQATPTGMAWDPARPEVAYVALLAFSMPPAPNGQIRRLEDMNGDGDALDAGENTLLIDGLTTPTDLAFNPQQQLFVTEIAPATLAMIDDACLVSGGPCAASARRIVARNLYGASGLVFEADGDAWVAVNGIPSPGAAATLASDRLVRLAASSLVPGVEPTVTTTPTAGTGTPSLTPMATVTGTLTATMTPMATVTRTLTATMTPIATVTSTLTATMTPVATITSTLTATTTPVATDTSTVTATTPPMATVTSTLTATTTPMVTVAATMTPPPTIAATPTPTAVIPTATSSPSPTQTRMPSPTSTSPRPSPTTPTPVSTPGTPTGVVVCLTTERHVPAAAIAAALADPTQLAGWGQRCFPNVPAYPWNTLRMSLMLQNPSLPYHPLFNDIVLKCGCQ